MKRNLAEVLAIEILVLIALGGCSSKQDDQSKEKVKAFLTAYQQEDASCGKYLAKNDNNDVVIFSGVQSILADSIDYKIKSVESDENYSIVNTVITNKDFGKVFEELLNNEDSQLGTSDEIYNELLKRLKDEKAPTKEFEVPIKLDSDSKILMTSELSNALLGGYTQFIYDLTTDIDIKGDQNS